MSYQVECSLQLTHGAIDDVLSNLKTQSFSGKRKIYRKLRKLEIRRTLHIKAHGSCCWEIYQRSGLKGSVQHVDPGMSIYPMHQPRSIKRVCC